MKRKLLALAMLAASFTLPQFDEDSDGRKSPDNLEDEVSVPGLGRVPRELQQKGIGYIDPKLAKKIVSLYRLNLLFGEGTRHARDGVSFDIAARVQDGQEVGVLNSDGQTTYYNQHNVWADPHESRMTYAGLLRERLGELDETELVRLNPELEQVVNAARENSNYPYQNATRSRPHDPMVLDLDGDYDIPKKDPENS